MTGDASVGLAFRLGLHHWEHLLLHLGTLSVRRISRRQFLELKERLAGERRS